jgi:hypothetical protein
MNRKRLNLTLRITDYEYTKKLASQYGFNSVCGFVAEVLNIFLNYSKNPPAIHRRLPTIKEEITQMFSELIDYEQTPANTLPTVRHLNRDPERIRQERTQDDTTPDDSLTDIEYLEDITSVYTQSIDELLQSDLNKSKLYNDSDRGTHLPGQRHQEAAKKNSKRPKI